MIDSSERYSVEEAVKILFQNFVKSVPDTQAIIALDADRDATIASCLSEGESEDSFKTVSSSIRQILDRLTRELVTGSGPVSFFDTDQNRLIFIKIKNVILSIALKLDGSVDSALPYAYLTAEKVGNIVEGRPVELNIPLIKIITDEDEQRMVREHFYELRSSEGNFQFKVVVVGDENVGKSSLILRHAENKFKENYLPTLGVSITTNSFDLPLRKAKVVFSTWDFGGQAYFRRVRLSYYAGAQACFIVFDLTNRKSFDNVLSWQEERSKLAGNVITILLGNKNDLVSSRAVTQQEAIEFANEHGFTYFETSALTGANVQDAFNLLAYKLVDMEARKVEASEMGALKEEIASIVEDAGRPLKFGLIRNKQYFAPVLQVFMEMDSNPEMMQTNHLTHYKFSLIGIELLSLEIKEKEYFPKQIEMLKDLDGVLGIFDARRAKDMTEVSTFARFLKLLYKEATNENFTGSIGILCEKDKYSDFMAGMNFSDVLSVDMQSKKSVYFYNLSDNYLLEISDNLKMLFMTLGLL